MDKKKAVRGAAFFIHCQNRLSPENYCLSMSTANYFVLTAQQCNFK